MRDLTDSMQSMDSSDAPAARPRTATVLLLLVMAALTFSYLGAYALSDALVKADVLSPWPADFDPRPRWMLTAFASLMGSFLCVGAVARFLSWRQLRRIDAMAEA